jgi:hypothetical protein
MRMSQQRALALLRRSERHHAIGACAPIMLHRLDSLPEPGAAEARL